MQLPAMFDNLYLPLSILFGGGIMALIVVALMGCYSRARLSREIAIRQSHEAALLTQIDHYETFFNLHQQCLIVWQTHSAHIEIYGTVPQTLTIAQAGAKGKTTLEPFLDFASWWPPEAAQELTQAVQRLEDQADPFDLCLDTDGGCLFHARGWRVGTHMMLSFAALSPQMHEYLQRKTHSEDTQARLTTLQMLLDEVKQPVWMRDDDGMICWGNRTYFRVSGPNHELLPEAAREKITTTLVAGAAYHDKIPTIIEGDRRILDVTVVRGPSGSAGMGVDNTQMAVLAQETSRTISSYLAIFDELPTAIAIFDANQKLEFFNQSFVKLWPLDIAFLETRPSHALLLDRLRENRILAENPDWRQWKEKILEAYHTLDPQLHIWNLLDGRTLRVVANPGPKGGVAWLYEDLSEKLHLEARYNTLIHMQGETLDHLYEGVAVFGPDGRLRLANPSFAKIWNLPSDLTTQGVHINQIETFCTHLCAGEDWHLIAALVTGFTDRREMGQDKIVRLDERIIEYKLVPLPQGQTMVSFMDVSDRVKVAQALAERNEALESANRLRTDFVSHVSYELRTPLTNIIGFTQLLRRPDFGELNERQHEYLNDISTQSIELLNLVNDILDLATLDAGIMQLDISEVDIDATMRAAVARIEERMTAKKMTLEMKIDENLNRFQADAVRVRQILFNLLANAVNFAPDSSTIDFSAHREGEQVSFCVTDRGPGIPADILNQVFDRFYAHAQQGRRSGSGLGLSIVKSFVELHHGSVEIVSKENEGTTISCRFPLIAAQAAQ